MDAMACSCEAALTSHAGVQYVAVEGAASWLNTCHGCTTWPRVLAKSKQQVAIAYSCVLELHLRLQVQSRGEKDEVFFLSILHFFQRCWFERKEVKEHLQTWQKVVQNPSFSYKKEFSQPVPGLSPVAQPAALTAGSRRGPALIAIP